MATKTQKEAEEKAKAEAQKEAEATMLISTYIDGTLRTAGEVVYGDVAEQAKKAKVAE